MSAAAITTTSTPLPSLSQATERLYSDNKTDQINSLNEFIIHQANAVPDLPLICYPSGQGADRTWVRYTAKQLDEYADEAAKELAGLGLRPKVADLIRIHWVV